MSRHKKDEERRFVLASKVAVYKGWQLKVHCQRCRETRIVQLDSMDGSKTMEQIRAALRCRVHRIRPLSVVLSHEWKRLTMDL